MIGRERPNSSARPRRGCEKPAPEKSFCTFAPLASPLSASPTPGRTRAQDEIVWLPPGRDALTP